jgi:hypothetical protein
LPKTSSLAGSWTERCVRTFSSNPFVSTGVGGVFDRVVTGEGVADPGLIDSLRCSFPSMGSDIFVAGSACVKGARLQLADWECVLLKSPDMAFLIPLSLGTGVVEVGVFGDFASETRVWRGEFFLPNGGGVAAVFNMSGGLV